MSDKEKGDERKVEDTDAMEDTIELTDLLEEAHDMEARPNINKPYASTLGSFGRALFEVAKVSSYGVTKYGLREWETVIDGEDAFKDRMWRNLLKCDSEEFDSEALKKGMKIYTEAEVIWSALVSLELKLRRLEGRKPATPTSFAKPHSGPDHGRRSA